MTKIARVQVGVWQYLERLISGHEERVNNQVRAVIIGSLLTHQVDLGKSVRAAVSVYGTTCRDERILLTWPDAAHTAVQSSSVSHGTTKPAC